MLAEDSPMIALAEGLPSDPQSPAKTSAAPIVYVLTYTLLPQIFTGLVDLPAGRFMKETLGWGAATMALFGLICSIPGYFSPMIAYLRDRWSPFGMGDRGFFLIAAPMIAAACAWNSVSHPTFNHFIFGALLWGAAFLLLAVAGGGLSATFSQRYGIGSKLAPLNKVGIIGIGAAAPVVGGMMAERLTYRTTLLALMSGTALMLAFAFWRPKTVDLRQHVRSNDAPRHLLTDLRSLLRSRVFLMIVLFSMMWSFSAVSDSVLLFFWRDRLHLSMESIGRVQGLICISNLPAILAYPFLVRKFDFRRLIVIGVLLASLEYIPLLWAHNLASAYISCLSTGFFVAFVNTAICDLQWKFCPEGIEASGMAVCGLLVGIMTSFSAVLGGWVLDRFGLFQGFQLDVLLTSLSCILIAPCISLIPRRTS